MPSPARSDLCHTGTGFSNGEGSYQELYFSSRSAVVFWTVELEKTLESLLDSKEIKPVNPKGNQPWTFIRSTEAEAPTVWPPNVKRQLIGKDPDARKDWGQKKGAIDRMVDGITDLTGMSLSKLQEILEKRGAWCAAVQEVPKSQTWHGDLEPTTFQSFEIFSKISKKRKGLGSFKSILVSERSQFKKVTYYVVPSKQHSGKDRNGKTVRRWVLGEMHRKTKNGF